MSTAVASLARRLIAVRDGGALLEAFGDAERPRDLAEAQEVASEVAAAQGPRAGWKIGATAPGAPAALGLAEPLFAPIPRAGLRESPAVWTAGPDGLTLDAELVFELGATPATPTLAGLRAATRAVRLAIEINRPSYARPFEAGGLAIIADLGAHAGLVQGPRLDEDADLATFEVVLDVDGVGTVGSGAAVMGDPRLALIWLAGVLPRYGHALSAGDVVASGALCSVRVGPRAQVRLVAEGLPAVELAVH